MMELPGTFTRVVLKSNIFCFGLDYLILLCTSIALHLVVYFGTIEGLFERGYFSKAVFSLSNVFTLRGPFNNVFKMFE